MKIDVKEYLNECYPDEDCIITFDGLDDAFIGVGYRFNKAIACYNKDAIIAILVDRDGMTIEEANEFFDFNIAGSYLGERTPVIVEDMFL